MMDVTWHSGWFDLKGFGLKLDALNNLREDSALCPWKSPDAITALSVATPGLPRAGLAGAQWYAAPIPRKRLKELMQRRNGPAIRHTLLWFALLVITGGIGYYTWGTWWCVPPSWAMEFSMARPPIPAGMNAAMDGVQNTLDE